MVPPQSHRDIVIWPHAYSMRRVAEPSEHVDPLAYPLLFPCGDQGWHPDLRHAEQRRTAAYTRLTAGGVLQQPHHGAPTPGHR